MFIDQYLLSYRIYSAGEGEAAYRHRGRSANGDQSAGFKRRIKRKTILTPKRLYSFKEHFLNCQNWLSQFKCNIFVLLPTDRCVCSYKQLIVRITPWILCQMLKCKCKLKFLHRKLLNAFGITHVFQLLIFWDLSIVETCRCFIDHLIVCSGKRLKHLLSLLFFKQEMWLGKTVLFVLACLVTSY